MPSTVVSFFTYIACTRTDDTTVKQAVDYILAQPDGKAQHLSYSEHVTNSTLAH
jgi:hypothetical protein